MNQGEKKLLLVSAFILLVAALNAVFPKISLVGAAFADMPAIEMRPVGGEGLQVQKDSAVSASEVSLISSVPADSGFQADLDGVAGSSGFKVDKPASTGLVAINSASKKELQRIKGVGPALAERIIDFRNQHGAFKSAKSLQKVKGIGPKKAKNILSQVKFD